MFMFQTGPTQPTYSLNVNIYIYIYIYICVYMCTYVCIHILGNRDTQKMEQFSESKG